MSSGVELEFGKEAPMVHTATNLVEMVSIMHKHGVMQTPMIMMLVYLHLHLISLENPLHNCHLIETSKTIVVTDKVEYMHTLDLAECTMKKSLSGLPHSRGP